MFADLLGNSSICWLSSESEHKILDEQGSAMSETKLIVARGKWMQKFFLVDGLICCWAARVSWFTDIVSWPDAAAIA
jgi:hypothetical protein